MFKKKNSEPKCPLVKDYCWGEGCTFWKHIRGTSPQGGEIDMPDCSINWLPVLLIENSKVGRETGAAVESFRNEVSKANAVALTIANQHSHPHLVDQGMGSGFLPRG